MIHGINFSEIRAFNIRMTQGPLPDGGIKGKTIHSATGGIDQHSGRTIHHISGRYLLVAGLKKIFFGHHCTNRGDPAVYTENSTYGYIHIDIGAAIERVVETDIFRFHTLGIIKSHKIIQFLTGNSGTGNSVLQNPGKLVIGENIQFFDFLPLYINGTRISQDIHQTGFVHLHIHPFGCQGDIPQQV